MTRKKLKTKDLFFVALYGVRARKGRATLTSIGIGIGIAAIVAVSGISASGRADLLSTLESLGTILVKAISTIVTSDELLDVIGGNLTDGRFIKDGLSNIPVTVLGSVTAQRLGINNLIKPTKILIENEWFGVVGILEELKIHPDLDRSVFIGYGVAKTLFDIDEEPTTIYLRANPTFIEDVVEVLSPYMNPENPDQLEVTRP